MQSTFQHIYSNLSLVASSVLKIQAHFANVLKYATMQNEPLYHKFAVSVRSIQQTCLLRIYHQEWKSFHIKHFFRYVTFQLPVRFHHPQHLLLQNGNVPHFLHYIQLFFLYIPRRFQSYYPIDTPLSYLYYTQQYLQS